MQDAKLGLSEEERRLVQDPGVILTKNRIINKVYALFGTMAEGLQAMPWPEGTELASPKISRGENFRGLPYVMLDFPRLFSNQHVLALRTHFWWGNYMSVTLHLKGHYQERFLGKVAAAVGRLQEGFWVACTEDEWEHAIVSPFYQEIGSMDDAVFRTHIGTHPFLKLSRKFPLETSDMGAALAGAYQTLHQILQPPTSHLQPET